MTHLGSWVSALADGQLPPDQAEAALAHVAACRGCALELAAARAARRRLAGAGDVPVAPDLAARLLELGRHAGATSVPQAPPGLLPDTSVPLPWTGGGARLPRGGLTGELARRRLPRGVLAAAVAGSGLALVGLVNLGQEPTVAPSAHPAYALTVLGHAATGTTSGAASATLTPAAWPPEEAPVDLEGPEAHARVLEWLEDHGWTSPVALPPGYRVTGLRLETGEEPVLELDLVGPAGVAVLLQEHGRLDPAAVAGASVLDVEGREVHVLSRSPWQVVWQSDDTVVTLVASGPSRHLEGLIAAHPDRGYDDGVPARISRGWHAVAGSWLP